MFFSGEVAWVTGSSTGIGRAVAVGLAKHGCDVVVHYNRSESDAREVAKEVQALGRNVLLARGDVSDAGDVRRMALEIEEHYGRLDVLVNNAGAPIERRLFSEIGEELWDRVMEVNLKSVYLCCQAVLPLMRRRGGGRIVNMTSNVARSGGSPGLSAYAAAKGGVSTLTRSMARELAAEGILVNAVSPGVISTALHDRITPVEVREKLVQSVPLAREGTPEEVARVVVFLASTYADYLVGETVEVNGGQLMD